MKTSIYRLSVAILLFIASYAAGYTLSKKSDEVGISARADAPMLPAVATLSMEEALAQADLQRQLQWLALRGEEEIDFPPALDDLLNRGAGRHRKMFHEMLTLWASRDPEAARAYVLGLKEPVLKSALVSLVNGWAQKDVASLAEWLKTKEVRKFRSLHYGGLVAVARHDPNLAFSLIDNAPRREHAIYQLFRTLASSDLRAALHLIDQLPPEERKQGISGLLQQWVRSDSQAALSWVRQLTDNDVRISAVMDLVSTLSQFDLKQTASLVAGELGSQGIHPDQKHTLLHYVLSHWNREDPAATRAWIDSLPPQTRAMAMETNKHMLAQVNPTEYLKLLEQTRTLSLRENHILNMAISALALTEPTKVSEWIAQNREWLPQQALVNAIPGLMTNAPELATQLLPTFPKGSFATSAYESAGASWADKDPEGAARFFASLPPGSERDAFQKGLFTHTARNDLQAAYAMLDAIPAGPHRANLLQSLAYESKEYQATADWVSHRYGDSSEATNALSTIMRKWGETSPVEAAAWLQKTPEGDAREQLVYSFSTSIVRHDPEMAIEWASTLNDEQRRKHAMENIAVLWLQNDRASAREWIRSAPFTDQEKEQLLKN